MHNLQLPIKEGMIVYTTDLLTRAGYAHKIMNSTNVDLLDLDGAIMYRSGKQADADLRRKMLVVEDDNEDELVMDERKIVDGLVRLYIKWFGNN